MAILIKIPFLQAGVVLLITIINAKRNGPFIYTWLAGGKWSRNQALLSPDNFIINVTCKKKNGLKGMHRSTLVGSVSEEENAFNTFVKPQGYKQLIWLDTEFSIRTQSAFRCWNLSDSGQNV